jgi:hypothetical protein
MNAIKLFAKFERDERRREMIDVRRPEVECHSMSNQKRFSMNGRTTVICMLDKSAFSNLILSFCHS